MNLIANKSVNNAPAFWSAVTESAQSPLWLPNRTTSNARRRTTKSQAEAVRARAVHALTWKRCRACQSRMKPRLRGR